jgi:hypothetical protein
MVQRIEEITEGLPSGHDTFIQAIGPDIWPLPWYLRGFTQIGYWQDASQLEDAPLIISDADAWPSLEGRLQDKYQTCTYGLRPEVFLFLNVRQDVWKIFMEGKSN